MHRSSQKILRVDASMRRTGSVTRELTNRVIEKLSAETPATSVVTRDLADGIPMIDETWIGANFTEETARDDTQRAALAVSDALIAELRAADTLVIGLPIYNFGVPAALKAWIDLVARARVTFRYSETGPVGLLGGKRAVVVAASGGVPLGSEVDFATSYLRHALAFIGITDVTFIGAERLMADAGAARRAAEDAIDSLAA